MEMFKEDKLHYSSEHLTCKNYLNGDNAKFQYWELKKGYQHMAATPAQWNYLVVLIQGRLTVHCDTWTNREISSGEIFVIPKGSQVRGECLEECKVVTFAFDSPATNCDKLNFQHLAELSSRMDYNLNTLPVRHPVGLFLELLVYYLSQQANCFHLHEIKGNEFFLCLRFFYTKKELASLFYPILTHSQDFRSFVLENYSKVKSVKELIALSNMSRSVFYTKFTSEFGTSAKQWMTEKFMCNIVYRASEPGITVKKLMFDLEFGSLSHFQIYCKHNLGCTPSELISRSAKGKMYFRGIRR